MAVPENAQPTGGFTAAVISNVSECWSQVAFARGAAAPVEHAHGVPETTLHAALLPALTPQAAMASFLTVASTASEPPAQ